MNYVRYVEQNPDIFFFTTGESGDYVYGMYITPAAAEGKSDALFSSLHFERIHISDQVHGSPDEAKKRLEEEMEEYKKKMEEADRQMQALRDSEQDRLLTYYSMLKYERIPTTCAGMPHTPTTPSICAAGFLNRICPLLRSGFLPSGIRCMCWKSRPLRQWPLPPS